MNEPSLIYEDSPSLGLIAYVLCATWILNWNTVSKLVYKMYEVYDIYNGFPEWKSLIFRDKKAIPDLHSL